MKYNGIELIRIGYERDFYTRELDPELNYGSMMNDVYMDPSTNKVYVEQYIFSGELREYDGICPIAYVGSKPYRFVNYRCYASDVDHDEYDIASEDDILFECYFDPDWQD